MRPTRLEIVALCGLALCACYTGTVRGPGTLPVRDQLVTGHPERQSFGAYSYILFRTAPRADAERSRSLFERWLLFPSIEEAAVDPRGLNVTYVPVRTRAPGQMTSAWLLESYDLARSQDYLRTLELTGRGPFIVTSSVPLSVWTPARPEVSVIDLSDATVKTMPLWVAHFDAVSQRADTWLTRGARALALTLHEQLEGADVALGSTLRAIDRGRTLLKALGEAHASK